MPYTLHLAASDVRALQKDEDAVRDKGYASSRMQQTKKNHDKDDNTDDNNKQSTYEVDENEDAKEANNTNRYIVYHTDLQYVLL